MEEERRTRTIGGGNACNKMKVKGIVRQKGSVDSGADYDEKLRNAEDVLAVFLWVGSLHRIF